MSDATIRDHTAPKRPWRLVALWTSIVVVVLLWWAVRYASFVGLLGEWQFANAQGYFPVLTVLVVALLVTIPIAIFVSWRERRQRKREMPVDRVALALSSARRSVWLFGTIVAAALLAMLTTAVLMFSIDVAPGAPTPFRIDDAALAEAPKGMVRIVGDVDLAKVGKFREQVGPLARELFVAPVRARQPDGRLSPTIRYFTMVTPVEGDETRFVPLDTGMLRKDGLPPELVPLFRGMAGLTISDTPALLLPDAAAWRWRYWAFFAECAGVAVIAAIFFFLARRHRKRLIARTAAIQG